MKPFGHLTDQSLARNVDGGGDALTASQRRHLASCEHCTARAQAHDAIASTLSRHEWADVEVRRRPARAAAQFAPTAALSGALVVLVLIGLRVAAAGPQSAPSGPPIVASNSPSQPSPRSSASSEISVPNEADTTVAWAPDSRHLLLAGADGTRLLDSAGNVLLRVGTSTAAGWLDDRTFATWTPAANSASFGAIALVTLDGTSTALPGDYTFEFVGSGRGELALVPADADHPAGSHTFVIWSQGQASKALEGQPLGWSPDGSALLVSSGVPQLLGADLELAPLSLVEYPSLRENTIAGLKADPKYTPAFSADGRWLALNCAVLGDGYDCGQAVVPTAGGQPQIVARQPIGLPLSWLPGDRLLLAASTYPAPGPLQAWSATGVAAARVGSGSFGFAAASGAVALLTEDPNGGTSEVVVTSPTGASIATGAGDSVFWSPDGQQGILRPSDQAAPLLLVTVP
ncbi:MAG TPA: hypothetical protein VGI98_06185 [Candidatus Limnocylindrales bacterium]